MKDFETQHLSTTMVIEKCKNWCGKDNMYRVMIDDARAMRLTKFQIRDLVDWCLKALAEKEAK